jgi:uncharacterized membrane protein
LIGVRRDILRWSRTALISAACAGRDEQPADDSASIAPLDAVVASPIPLPLRALGTEPFWALDIDSNGLRFNTPDDTSGIRFPPVAPSTVGDTVVWIGQTESTSIEARVWPAKCSDGMSDREYPYASVVQIKGTTYRGCADRRP